jgi:SAM-dependent methyltransferase
MTASSPPATAAGYDAAAYWSARLSARPGLEGVGWLGLGYAYNRWLYHQRQRVFMRVAQHYGFDRRPPAVLELGAGSGFYVRLWQRLGVRSLTGIDIAAPAVARLQRRFPRYCFQAGDVGGPLHLPAGMFDVVTAFDVLFHIVDDAAFDHALGTIARTLRPGGVALITDLFPKEAPPSGPAHQLVRAAATYRARLAAHGLRVERRWPVFVLMHPWVDVSRPPLRMVGRGWWWLVERAAGHIPDAGGPLGAVLYAVDGPLTRLLRDGPSTELWAVRRTEG